MTRPPGALAAVLLALAAHAAAAEPVAKPTALDLRLDAELFSAARYHRAGSQRASEVELERGELGLRLAAAWLRGELRGEMIRSAGPGSLLGIDGDSLVFRAKRAWAGGEVDAGPVRLALQGGLIDDPWIAAIDAATDARELSPSVGELAGMWISSDLGAAMRATLGERASLTVALMNGEGRALREQNQGKDLVALASVTALCPEVLARPTCVRVLLSGRDGSRGPGSARDHRLAAAVTWTSAIHSVGVEAVRSDGTGGDPALDQAGIGMWAWAVVPALHAGGLLRFDAIDQDVAAPKTGWKRTTASVFADLAPVAGQRLRLHLGVAVDRYDARAAPLPGLADALDQESLFAVLALRSESPLVTRQGPPP